MDGKFMIKVISHSDYRERFWKKRKFRLLEEEKKTQRFD
jgi:hypothetical protein